MTVAIPLSNPCDRTQEELIFNQIAEDIIKQGYSVSPYALPPELANSLFIHQQALADEKFKNAGIGRGDEFIKKKSIRTDEICWINGESRAGKEWLDWAANLKVFLNRRLFLGLFSFESHFAHYGPGDYYKRHYDAFRGETNRILSVVVYFNKEWSNTDGGELVLYKNNQDKQGIKILPHWATVVTFLSEEFPHEVLPATRDRYSIAGWFRVNTSTTAKVDPPL